MNWKMNFAILLNKRVNKKKKTVLRDLSSCIIEKFKDAEATYV